MKDTISPDWDFVNCNKKESIHSVHPYPAKFIPEIPRTLLQLLAPDKTGIVFDPFCGSGVTLYEAQKMGYKTLGVDINPIGCLISSFKVSPLPADFYSIALDCCEKASKKRVQIPEIPNLSHWFIPESQQALASLISVINNRVTNEYNKIALKVAFSSIVVRASNQESDTRYAAIKKQITREKILDYFLSSCKKILKAKELESHEYSQAKVLNESIVDLRTSQFRNRVGIVITSPPYPNAYEYWLYHKYRMWWLGYDPLKVKENEIGARAHYFKKKHHTAEDFERQMDVIFDKLDVMLMKRGYACFVIGRSIIHGKQINNDEIIERIALKHNYEMVKKISRNILLNRKSFNLSHAKIKTEHVMILRNK